MPAVRWDSSIAPVAVNNTPAVRALGSAKVTALGSRLVGIKVTAPASVNIRAASTKVDAEAGRGHQVLAGTALNIPTNGDLWLARESGSGAVNVEVLPAFQ